MDKTPASLVERLRHPGDEAAWERFVELYTPVLLSWARHVGLQDQDAADLVQDVFTVLVRKLPEFHYDPQRSFRAWLRTVTLNKWRDNCKRRSGPTEVEDAAALDGAIAPGDDFWESEYRRHLIARALEIMKGEFQETTWRACWEFVVHSRPAAEVAAELGISPNAVYIAKSRVLRRLRQELDGLIEESCLASP